MPDEIRFGNPNQQHLVYTAESSPFDKHVETLMKFTPPLNSSKGTKEELNELVDYIKEVKNTPHALNTYMAYDESLEKFLAENVVSAYGIDEAGIELIDKLLDYSYPLIYKLKYHFQRPRPYQLGQHYKLKLFPFKSYTADSPSYPSFHAFAANLICHVLGNHYPDKFEQLDALAKDIMYSRLKLGLNYQSDIDLSMYAFELVTKDKIFKATFKL
jgi:hypothetical protein